MIGKMTLGRRQFLSGAAISLGSIATAACSQAPAPAAPGPAPAPNTGRTLSPADLEDSLTGCSYLGCGGGGSLAEARELIRADLAAGHDFSLLDVEALDDDDRVACPYALASLAPLSAEFEQRLAALDGRIEMPVLNAFSLLERHLETRFSGVILGEMGPLSMAEGLSIAARLGVPALDADTVGRATPEINQHSVRVAGHSLIPAAAVTPFGDEIVLTGLLDTSRQEDVFRALTVVSGLVGVADAPITGAVAKSDGVLIKNSFSLAMRIGAAVREAKSAGTDPIEAARLAGDGYRLFTGRVGPFDWADRDGFLAGHVDIEGDGAFTGQTMRLDYKNEHLVARIGNDTVATCPDLITLVDRASAEGVNNPDFVAGQAVEVLGFKCDPVWRSEAGLAVFSPRYFGYDVDYIPIESRMARRR
ncbi:DUF917 domain-containing protein [Maricaulis sp.]|uniref:DUF917 domain-containing protein n=1 Tax=Maricaulis sp. TaxID=1486257 RepID=UPI002619B93D|nr:DUF917 domain-containing protein [Maricaulis sp.]